jgi:4-amino-4-deoxy-L-arabinose transferase-like glycosyltransferase
MQLPQPPAGSGVRSATWITPILFVGLALYLGYLLGQRGLNEPDEGRYANIAIGFLQPGADWWEPRMSGFGHYDKPPLIYWLTAASLKTLGHHEWAARLPPWLGAVLTLVGLYWAANRLYSKQVALLAIFLAGTLVHVWAQARWLSTDTLLTGWCTLAVGAWAEGRFRAGSGKWWWVSLGFWVLAWWTKATAALVPLLALWLALWITGDGEGRKALRFPWLLPAILLLGAPWFVVMMVRHPELKDFFLGRELVGRVAGGVHHREGPFGYYLATSAVAWLPWWPVLLGAWWAKRAFWPLRSWRDYRHALGVDGWCVIVGVAVFSCISSKLPSYTLPFAPWLALGLARGVLAVRPHWSDRAFRRLIAWPAAGCVAVIAVATPIFPRFEAELGSGSSLRPVARRLQQEGAELVLLDRYWPGIEFYFGSDVRYVLPQGPRQRPDDPGKLPGESETRFCPPASLRECLDRHRAEQVWLVRYTRQKNSPFEDLISAAEPQRSIRVGHFLLVPVTADRAARPP